MPIIAASVYLRHPELDEHGNERAVLLCSMEATAPRARVARARRCWAHRFTFCAAAHTRASHIPCGGRTYQGSAGSSVARQASLCVSPGATTCQMEAVLTI